MISKITRIFTAFAVSSGKKNAWHKVSIGGIPVRAEDWEYDPVGNWRRWRQAAEGVPLLDQSRVHNRDNQITQIQGSCEGIAHDLRKMKNAWHKVPLRAHARCLDP